MSKIKGNAGRITVNKAAWILLNSETLSTYNKKNILPKVSIDVGLIGPLLAELNAIEAESIITLRFQDETRLYMTKIAVERWNRPHKHYINYVLI